MMEDLETVTDDEIGRLDWVHCNDCDDTFQMEYIGSQYIDNIKVFELYNCPKCGTTKADHYTKYFIDNYEV